MRNIDNRTNCDICGIEIKETDSHNADPLIKEGRCCTACNSRVITERLAQSMQDAHLHNDSLYLIMITINMF